MSANGRIYAFQFTWQASCLDLKARCSSHRLSCERGSGSVRQLSFWTDQQLVRLAQVPQSLMNNKSSTHPVVCQILEVANICVFKHSKSKWKIGRVQQFSYYLEKTTRRVLSSIVELLLTWLTSQRRLVFSACGILHHLQQCSQSGTVRKHMYFFLLCHTYAPFHIGALRS